MSPLLDEEDVFDRVGGSLGHLCMSRPLEQIAARGSTHLRRRAALTAVAGVAVVTALGAVVISAQSGNTVRAVSTADGATDSTSVTHPIGLTDPDWTVTATSGGYLVDITALGDVAGLNATLKSLDIEIKVAERVPSDGRSDCPADVGTSSTQSAPATAGTATFTPTATSPDTESPTPVSFPVSGATAAFTFGDLPKESVLSFTAFDGRSQPHLGTVRISDYCLPVFGP
jgi:hypothetical protein